MDIRKRGGAIEWIDADDPVLSPERQIQRTRSLEALGYRNYSQYLRSSLWRAIRIYIYQRADGKCEDCYENQPAVIHHLSYDIETMRGCCFITLLALCDDCHLAFHGRHVWRRTQQQQLSQRLRLPKRLLDEHARKTRDMRPRLVKR